MRNLPLRRINKHRGIYGRRKSCQADRGSLYQALETELGGVEVYKTALRCAVNEDLKEEWEKYLEQTQNHVQVVSDMLNEMDLVRQIIRVLISWLEMIVSVFNTDLRTLSAG